MVGFIILTLVLSAFIGWITIPNIIIISKRKRLFDSHNSRKVHTGAIPRLGGISFLPAVLVSFCLSLGIRHVTDGFDLNPLYVDEFYAEFLFFVAGLISLFFIGLADDLVGIGYKSKFLVQVVAAAMLVLADLNIKSFDGLFGIYYIHPVFSVLLTVFVVVGAVNAYNLIDGVDGLCSGLGAIALCVLSGWFYYHDLYAYTMLGVSLFGCVVTFFLYNTRGMRLKVFMGDGGSLMLGYIVSFLGLKFIDLNAGMGTFTLDTPNAELMVLSVVFIPVFDTVRVLTERIMKGRPPFFPDKTPIHQLFLRLGFTHMQSTGIILIMAIAIIMFNFALQDMNSNLLFVSDVLIGMVFLNWLPKYIIRKREGKAKNNQPAR